MWGVNITGRVVTYDWLTRCMLPFLLPLMPLQDGEIRKLFQRALTKQGMKFKLNTKVSII